MIQLQYFDFGHEAKEINDSPNSIVRGVGDSSWKAVSPMHRTAIQPGRSEPDSTTTRVVLFLGKV